MYNLNVIVSSKMGLFGIYNSCDFSGEYKNIHNMAIVANERYDSVSFTYTNQEGCSRIMGSIFKRILTVGNLI